MMQWNAIYFISWEFRGNKTKFYKEKNSRYSVTLEIKPEEDQTPLAMEDGECR